MKTVKISKNPLCRFNLVAKPGDVVEVPNELANKLIKDEYASLVEPKTEKSSAKAKPKTSKKG